MTLRQRKEKAQHLISTVVDGFFVADQKRALLEPLLNSEDLIGRWDNSLGAHGLDALRMSLYMGVLTDASAFLFDRDRRTASMFTLCELLAGEDLVAALKADYCRPLDIMHANPDASAEERRLVEQALNEERRRTQAEDFDRRLPAALEAYKGLCDSELAASVRAARDKMISHHEVKIVGDERRLYDPQDFGLKWGLPVEILATARSVVFDLNLLVRRSYYPVERFMAAHDDVAAAFWRPLQ